MTEGYSILVADDSITVQKIVELLFMDAPGITVSSVSNGRDALSTIRREAPDLLLADVHMEGPSGYDLCARAKEVSDATSVVLLVGAFEPFDLGRFRDCLADGALEKPFDSGTLLGMVESLLNGWPLVQPLALSPRRQLAPEGLLGERVDLTSRRWHLRVFLCHASQDKEAVKMHGRGLRSKGFEPWIDDENLLPGQDWDLAIRRALRESHAILVCLSKTSVSKAGYVQKEIKRALDLLEQQPEGSVFLIPVQLEDCSIPSMLQHLQVADLCADRGYEKLVASLEKRAQDLGLGGS